MTRGQQRLAWTLVGAVAGLWMVRRWRKPRLHTVDYVDLSKYAGTWYEIAAFPQRYEQDAFAATATYTPRKDGSIDVVNRCLQHGFEGTPKQIHGRAFVKDHASNARLKVRFRWPFTGDYYILALGERYEWALVGTPDRKALWILARTPVLPEDVYAQIIEYAQSLGFNTHHLRQTPQRAFGSERVPLGPVQH